MPLRAILLTLAIATLSSGCTTIKGFCRFKKKDAPVATVATDTPTATPAATQRVAPITKEGASKTPEVESHNSFAIDANQQETNNIIAELEKIIRTDKKDGAERRISYDPKANTILVIAPKAEKEAALKYLADLNKPSEKPVNENVQVTQEKTETATNTAGHSVDRAQPFNRYMAWTLPQDPFKNPVGRGQVSFRNSIAYYYGLPPKHYRVLGRLALAGYSSKEFMLNEAASVTRARGGNALILTNKPELNNGILKGSLPEQNTQVNAIYAWVISTEK